MTTTGAPSLHCNQAQPTLFCLAPALAGNLLAVLVKRCGSSLHPYCFAFLSDLASLISPSMQKLLFSNLYAESLNVKALSEETTSSTV